MVRVARARSKTGIYHIMLRGIDKRDIFIDAEDKVKFLENLLKAKGTAGFKLFGYCLMDNHVHLLIKESEDIGTSIKRITVGYVQWHNRRHERTGHLFQNRYMSEAVEDESYLINVLRYIHQNPIKARITKYARNYLWSSYNEYILSYQGQSTNIEAEVIKSYFKNIEDFEEYMNTETKDEFLDYKEVKKCTDSMLKKVIEKEIDGTMLKNMPLKERNRIIKKIYIETGASIRQLAYVLKIGKAIVEKAVK